MTWAYIDGAADSWDGVEHETNEAPAGFYANEVPPNFVNGGCVWNPDGKGWRDTVAAPASLSDQFEALLARLHTAGTITTIDTHNIRIGNRTP